MYTTQSADEIMEYVRKQLEETRGARRTLSLVTKIPYDTLAKIHQGLTRNPRIQTLVPLLHALRYHEAHCRWPDVKRPPRTSKSKARAAAGASASIGA